MSMEQCALGFVYTIEHIGVDGKIKSVERVHNLVPTGGLNYILGAALKGESQFATWYLGLYDNNYSPVAGDTMASLIAACGENQDYTGTARKTLVFPAIANGGVDTLSAPNTFAFTSSETIRGGFISSGPTWGGTTGLLVSAVLFPSPKIVAAGESLRVPVGFSFVSV
jgi:hypothetical protein